jgi:hypothetical protein
VLIFIVSAIALYVKDIIIEKNIYSKYFILISTFLIIFSIVYLSLLLAPTSLNLKEIPFQVLFYELLIITIIPLVLMLWYLEIQLFNINFKTITISDKSSQKNESKDITLLSDSKNMELSLDVRELLLVEAQDNYCKIYYEIEGEVKKAMLRLSLKKMHDQLAHLDNIIKCHRSYLINKTKIEKISGKSQSYKIKMFGSQKIIPVSRSFDINSIKNL